MHNGKRGRYTPPHTCEPAFIRSEVCSSSYLTDRHSEQADGEKAKVKEVVAGGNLEQRPVQNCKNLNIAAESAAYLIYPRHSQGPRPPVPLAATWRTYGTRAGTQR